MSKEQFDKDIHVTFKWLADSARDAAAEKIGERIEDERSEGK